MPHYDVRLNAEPTDKLGNCSTFFSFWPVTFAHTAQCSVRPATEHSKKNGSCAYCRLELIANVCENYKHKFVFPVIYRKDYTGSLKKD